MAGNIGGTVLDILGSLGTVAGPLLFGPDFRGDLGAPFAMGAAYLKQNKLANTIGDILKSTPHTAPIMDVADQVGQGGGLLNLLSGEQPSLGSSSIYDNLSAQADKPQITTGQDLQVDPSLGTVQLPSVAPSAIPQQPTSIGMQPQGSSDFKSLLGLFAKPDNFSKLAQVDPEGAMKLLTSGARTEADPTQLIMAALGMEQKAAAIPGTPQFQAKQKAEMEDYTNKLNLRTSAETAAQDIRDAGRKKEWAQQDVDMVKGINEYSAQLSTLPDELPPQSVLAQAGGKLFGPTVAGYISPEVGQLQRRLEDIRGVKGFANGGKQLTSTELSIGTKDIPSNIDSPEAYKKALAFARSKAKLNELSSYFFLEKKGRDVEDMKPVINQYSEWRTALNSGIPLADLQKSPSFVQATQQLGLGGLFQTFPKK